MDAFGSDVPGIRIQGSSPQTPYTAPQVGFLSSAYGTPYCSAPFTVREEMQVFGQLTSKQLLDFPVSIPVPPYADVQPSPSALTNTNYAFISSLTPWTFSPNLGGYLSLSPVRAYNPPDPDRTLNVNAESDISYALRHYISTPVGNVFSQAFPNYGITANAESPGYGNITIGGQSKRVVARVDLCWQLSYNQFNYVFAILEFKRPGCINWNDWSPATQNLPVGKSARLICQQLLKYAYTYGINKVAVCDGVTLVLLDLKGEASNWYGAADFTTIAASYQWITDLNEMKRYLYVFMYEALTAKLRSLRFIA
jgi:hypothetical protein